ncbi:cobalamin-dependent protein [Amycolatopsis lurida]
MTVPPRVLLAALDENPGLAEVARALRDEGIEVIYAGVLGTAEEVVSAAEQEDPAVVAVSPEVPGIALDGVEVVGFRTVQEGVDRVKMATVARSRARR